MFDSYLGHDVDCLTKTFRGCPCFFQKNYEMVTLNAVVLLRGLWNYTHYSLNNPPFDAITSAILTA